MSTRIYVVRTAHHGGGIVSGHGSRAAATSAAIRSRLLAACDRCQVVHTVPADEYPRLPHVNDARDLNAPARS